MQTTKDFQLRPDDRDTLKRWLRRPTTPSGQTRRARILLALDGGSSATDTARLLHISRATVHLWHRRYPAEGLGGLVDRPRSGRPTVLERRTVERILLLTTERVPMEATHWSTRLMARYAGGSHSGRCGRSGRPPTSSPIGSRRSSSVGTRTSPRRSSTSSADLKSLTTGGWQRKRLATSTRVAARRHRIGVRVFRRRCGACRPGRRRGPPHPPDQGLVARPPLLAHGQGNDAARASCDAVRGRTTGPTGWSMAASPVSPLDCDAFAIGRSLVVAEYVRRGDCYGP